MERGGVVKIAIYARVSTVDKDQNPETQLRPLREHVRGLDGEVVGEFVDHASADDQMDNRTAPGDPSTARARTHRCGV